MVIFKIRAVILIARDAPVAGTALVAASYAGKAGKHFLECFM
jgi:hypothetical protein